MNIHTSIYIVHIKFMNFIIAFAVRAVRLHSKDDRRLAVLGCHGDADGAVPISAGRDLVETLKSQGPGNMHLSIPICGV